MPANKLTLFQHLNYLSQTLTRTRNSHNITQEELAQALGVSTQSIRRWEERDFKSTSLANFIKIVKYLEERGIQL